MNRKLLLFTAIAMLAFGSPKAQDIVNLRMDAAWQGLRGPVASMDEDILIKKDYFRDDWPQRKWFRQDLRNCLQEDNGRVLTFNPQGRMTSITYTNKGVAGKKTTCSYASNGLLSSFVGEGYKVEAKYSGTVADINIFAETRDYSPKVNLSYANLNYAPYKNVYPFDMKCRQTLTGNGLILSSKYYYVDSVAAREASYTYNHLGLLVKEVVVDYQSDPDDPNISTILYEYDQNNLLVKKTIKGSSVNDVLTYVNNEEGDCVQLTVEHPYGNEVYTYEYQYDEYGNWTMRLQFKNGAFDCAALRTLSYHKKGATTADEIALTDEAKAAKKAKMDIENEANKAAADAEKEALKIQREQEREAAKAEKAAAREAAAAEKAAKKAAAQEAAAAEKAAKKAAAAEPKEKKVKESKVKKDESQPKETKAKKAKEPKEKKVKKAKEPKEKKVKKTKESKAKKKAKGQEEEMVIRHQGEVQTLGGDEKSAKAAEREMKRRAAAAEKAREKEYKQQLKARKAAEKENEKALKKAEKEAKKAAAGK